jgi:hypothetical protein
MKNVHQNATIIQKNGLKQLFDAIVITKKGIYTGVINIKNDGAEKFEEHGFIPKDQLEKITILNKEGRQKDIDFLKKSEEGIE